MLAIELPEHLVESRVEGKRGDGLSEQSARARFHCWPVTLAWPLQLAEAYIPPQMFYNGKVDYFDLQRLGGLLSHLRKTLKGRSQLLDQEQVPDP